MAEKAQGDGPLHRRGVTARAAEIQAMQYRTASPWVSPASLIFC